eukprot:CAMPEP_0185190054 /NCGR_PEP_ID=MMETSP1140-20130426/6404_1 /TAXON_ID=298111 /ORGANISM="Pavlova sp., Strain CCMP459" /LENGTH=431 /DNA_ID=CAMNT_0027756651 /DNA_START=498 /DNA_END=1791 /DNA_ORIENTATION=-
MALVQGVVASTQGPDVSVGQPAHGTHAPIVERLESCPEHLGQHPALTAVEQDSQHKTGVDLGPGACRKRRVAQVGVNHRLLQPCKESRRSLDPVNHLRLARERAIHDGTQVSKALGERDYAAAVTVRYRTVRDPCVDRESGDIIHDQDADVSSQPSVPTFSYIAQVESIHGINGVERLPGALVHLRGCAAPAHQGLAAPRKEGSGDSLLAMMVAHSRGRDLPHMKPPSELPSTMPHTVPPQAHPSWMTPFLRAAKSGMNGGGGGDGDGGGGGDGRGGQRLGVWQRLALRGEGGGIINVVLLVWDACIDLELRATPAERGERREGKRRRLAAGCQVRTFHRALLAPGHAPGVQARRLPDMAPSARMRGEDDAKAWGGGGEAGIGGEDGKGGGGGGKGADLGGSRGGNGGGWNGGGSGYGGGGLICERKMSYA